METVNEIIKKGKIATAPSFQEGSIEERNKNLVRYTIDEVWNKGNYSVLDEIIEPDFVIYSLSDGKKVIGRDGVINYLNAIKGAFPDIRFHIEDQVAEGDKVVTHWMAEGTHRGIFDGIPPSGKRLRITSIDIDYITNGRFSQCYANMNQFGLLQQLGVLGNDIARSDEAAPQAWDNIADGYDKYVTDTEIWLANEALKRVGLKHGQRFLDVAAGCGGLSLPAARLGAEVLAVDWSMAMIKRFEDRIRRENFKQARGLVMDGHRLDLPDNQFDVSGSQFGVMLFPDQKKALREMVRVTKPGGKVLLIAYGNPNDIDFLNFFLAAVKAVAPHFPGLPDSPPPLEFQNADPVILHRRLVDAGLKNVTVDTVTEKIEFTSGEQLWNWILNGNPIVEHLLSELKLTTAERSVIKQNLDDRLQKLGQKNGGVAILTNPVNIGYGTK